MSQSTPPVRSTPTTTDEAISPISPILPILPILVDEASVLLLMAYLDGELAPGEAATLKVRLQEEPELQEALASLAEGFALVREGFAAMRVPADLADSIARAVEQSVGSGAAQGDRDNPVKNQQKNGLRLASSRGSVPAPASKMRRLVPAVLGLLLPAAAGIFLLARAQTAAPLAMELPEVESAPSMHAVLAESEDVPGDMAEGDESAPLNDGEGVDLDEVEVSVHPVMVFTLPAVAARVHGTSVLVWMDDDETESGVENFEVPPAPSPP